MMGKEQRINNASFAVNPRNTASSEIRMYRLQSGGVYSKAPLPHFAERGAGKGFVGCAQSVVTG